MSDFGVSEDFGDYGSLFDTEETWPCNDCGLPCLKGDELCGPCYEKQRMADDWESAHPETRCPPRE